MDQCRRTCWIAGAVAGLAVLLASWAGGTALIAAVLLGLLTMGLLGGLLVWGLCQGRGTAAENEALMGAYWEPEPFTPSRRVVAPGGRVVSQLPLTSEAPDGLAASVPLERVTLHASRDPALAHLVPPPASPEAEQPPLHPPIDTATVLATPSVASAIPIEPLALPQLASGADGEAGSPGVALPLANGRQGTISDLLPDDGDDDLDPVDRDDDMPVGASLPSPDDPLVEIDGVGPMEARWLRDSGIEGLEQIARWDDADIARFAGMMGREGHRIRSQDWVGQAVRLTGGVR